MNLAEIRQDIADLLAGASANIYATPPTVPMLPAIIIVPADPYIQPITLGQNRFKVRFKITFAVAMTDNASSLNTIEDLAFYAYDNLPIGYSVLDTTNPQPTSLGQTDVLSCDLTIETIIQAQGN